MCLVSLVVDRLCIALLDIQVRRLVEVTCLEIRNRNLGGFTTGNHNECRISYDPCVGESHWFFSFAFDVGDIHAPYEMFQRRLHIHSGW